MILGEIDWQIEVNHENERLCLFGAPPLSSALPAPDGCCPRTRQITIPPQQQTKWTLALAHSLVYHWGNCNGLRVDHFAGWWRFQSNRNYSFTHSLLSFTLSAMVMLMTSVQCIIRHTWPPRDGGCWWECVRWSALKPLPHPHPHRHRHPLY